ncbi:MAG TPA: LON peptidase substrate-binding domain-containing protein [Candidatus Acidoferrales bacterium]|nr:LON peptidase substrate-binding domain-containing protein [Candidatus Acidoferrales bacterium]
MRPDRIPLFLLNVVLIPGADLPLHIFEPRYRGMVKNCLEDKTEFGVLLGLPNGMARVGCTAEITRVIQRYEDGRVDILTRGRAPFRVTELLTKDALLEGMVEYLEDEDSPAEAAVRKQLFELYEACYTLVFGDYPRDVEEQAGSGISYHMAASLPLDLLWKQQLLELRDEAARQARLVALFRDWAPHLQQASQRKRGAGGNGHGWN